MKTETGFYCCSHFFCYYWPPRDSSYVKCTAPPLCINVLKTFSEVNIRCQSSKLLIIKWISFKAADFLLQYSPLFVALCTTQP